MAVCACMRLHALACACMPSHWQVVRSDLKYEEWYQVKEGTIRGLCSQDRTHIPMHTYLARLSVGEMRLCGFVTSLRTAQDDWKKLRDNGQVPSNALRSDVVSTEPGVPAAFVSAKLRQRGATIPYIQSDSCTHPRVGMLFVRARGRS